MKVEGIDKVCVVGAGTMGHQIALCAAMAGYRTKCMDTSLKMMEKAADFTERYLSGRVSQGKMAPEVAQAGRDNLSFTSSLEEAAEDADLAIEVVPEILELKRKIFSQLDKICPDNALLVTNSSYIVSSRLADATGRPEKVCNMHFFVPPVAMLPVEVVKGPHTSVETANTIAGVCKSMGKIPILLEKEIKGFLVNRILTVIKREALFLYDTGVAAYEDIDTAVVEGLGHKIPPFRLMDLVGLDLSLLITTEHYRETGDPINKPSPAIVEKVALNLLGRKTGKGFYDYSEMLAKRGY